MTDTQKRSPKEQDKLDGRLIEAAKNGSTEDVRRLIAQSANVHARDDLALRGAVIYGHAEMVKVLLAAGANVHAKDDTALSTAAAFGETEMVQALLVAGANVHADDDYALFFAANNDRMETVKVLLAAGADVHAKDDEALRWTAWHGHTDTVQVLAAQIFSADSWRGKSRAEIEECACALYEKIKNNYPTEPIYPDRLQKAASILVDCALTCWEQVRPRPPKLTISPLPAQPRPL